jgi:DNA-binding transcriptional MerR regulator
MKQRLDTTKEIAARYEKPIPTIQRWARMRIIPSIQLGHRTRLYDAEAVHRAILKRTVHEVEQP